MDTDYEKTIRNTDMSKEVDWAKYSGSTLVDATLFNIRRERRCEKDKRAYIEQKEHYRKSVIIQACMW